jgi:hypothetical protein
VFISEGKLNINQTRLQDEPARVEDELVHPSSIAALLKCFTTSKAVSFENLLDPFLKIIRLSSGIAVQLSRSSAFFKRIVDRISHTAKAVVRLNLLKILRSVCDIHPNRALLVERFGLLGLVQGLSQSGGDGAVLVRELARDILPLLKPGLKPAASRNREIQDMSPKTALAPKKMIRAASEASAIMSSTSSYSGASKSGRQKLGDIQWQS